MDVTFSNSLITDTLKAKQLEKTTENAYQTLHTLLIRNPDEKLSRLFYILREFPPLIINESKDILEISKQYR